MIDRMALGMFSLERTAGTAPKISQAIVKQ